MNPVLKTTKFVGIVVFSLMIIVFQQNSYAQIDGNGGLSLKGKGFALSKDSALSTSIDLLLTIDGKNTKEMALQNGAIVMNGKQLELSDFSGGVFANSNGFTINAKTLDPAEDFSVKMVGTLKSKGTTDSIYILTGTMESEENTVKLAYIAKLSEIAIKPKTEQAKNEVTTHILKGSANPEERTYKDQKGLRFAYFSQSRIITDPSTSITFVNDDTVPHTLVSGTANNSRHKPFIPDGKISSGEILPGKSWSVTYNERGFYRLFDPKYPWMGIMIFVSQESGSITLSSKNH